MALTDEGNGGIPATMLVGPTAMPYMPYGGGNGMGNGFGGDGGWWILLLFILLAGGNGWGNGFGGFGGGNVGSEIYPWMNQSNQINDGFRDQMINGNVTEIRNGVTGLATQLCNCCGDIQTSLCNGFAGVNSAISNGFSGAEIAANGRQMANMNQAFAAQTAMAQGFNGLQAQLAQCLKKVIRKVKDAFTFTNYEAVGTLAA